MTEFISPWAKKTEARVIENGRFPLTGTALKEKVVGKTVRGDYLGGRRYVSFMDADGTVDGLNDLGAYCVGKWSIDEEANTLTVAWNGCWDDWTGRAYDVDGTIQFYDCKTGLWRTTFMEFVEGRVSLRV